MGSDTVRPASTANCKRCGKLLPLVETANGDLVMVQPIACPSFAPSRPKIAMPHGTRTVTDLLGAALEHTAQVEQTLPAFIPHDFLCPDTAPLMRDLAALALPVDDRESRELADTLDFMGGVSEK